MLWRYMGRSGSIDPPFSASPLDGGEWSTSRPSRFTPRTYWTERWVEHRIRLDCIGMRETCPCRESNPDLPACDLVAKPILSYHHDRSILLYFDSFHSSSLNLMPLDYSEMLFHFRTSRRLRLKRKPPAGKWFQYLVLKRRVRVIGHGIRIFSIDVWLTFKAIFTRAVRY
jgi:hypothetical protein